VRKSETVTERKMGNMHLLKSLQARFKCGVKLTEKKSEKGAKRDGKKDGQ
jgi:hypothetical protein